jgi:lipoate-protein ligase B
LRAGPTSNAEDPTGAAEPPPLGYSWLGRVGFAPAVELQERLRARVLAGDAAAERLLVLEHDPVITLGRAADRAHVLASAEALARLGVTVARASRGGDVTYHGPGQLVAYPVLRLTRGVLAHVEAMAGAVVAVARSLGVDAHFRRDCPGVWVGDRKLAAFGLHVHRRVAIHGVALNVSTDLDAFRLIVPCGLAAVKTTSLAAESGRATRVEDLARPFAHALAAALGRPAIEHIRSLLSPSPPVE